MFIVLSPGFSLGRRVHKFSLLLLLFLFQGLDKGNNRNDDKNQGKYVRRSRKKYKRKHGGKPRSWKCKGGNESTYFSCPFPHIFVTAVNLVTFLIQWCSRISRIISFPEIFALSLTAWNINHRVGSWHVTFHCFAGRLCPRSQDPREGMEPIEHSTHPHSCCSHTSESAEQTQVITESFSSLSLCDVFWDLAFIFPLLLDPLIY